MKRMLIFAALTMGLALSASAQIIENGSFEDLISDQECDTLVFSSHYIVAWRTTSNVGNIRLSCSIFQASHGDKSVSLNGTSPGFIYQDIPTVPGVVYQATFDMSGIGSPALKTMTVTADDAQAANYEYTYEGNASDNMNWASRVYSFTAADDVTRLKFTSTTIGAFGWSGPFIDNVAAIARAGLVCHTNNGSGQPRTMNLTEGWAFWAHTQHGDQMGACP